MRAWQFSKPKGPGFGISKGYFLSVLSSHSVMPSIYELVNPKGEGGAVPGFGVPMGGNDKEMLRVPMSRGMYVVTSLDRKTVLKLAVVSKDEVKEEAGFDPETFALSAAALDCSPELVARLRATWVLTQLMFGSHDPDVYPALDFLVLIVQKLGELTEGVIGDSICQRYLLPEHVFSRARLVTQERVYAEEHVTVKLRARPDGLHAYTLGLQKFVMPEFEIFGLQEGDESNGATALMWLAQQVLLGRPVKEEYQVGSPGIPFAVHMGGFDKSLWDDLPVFELLPPTASTPGEALTAWADQISAARGS